MRGGCFRRAFYFAALTEMPPGLSEFHPARRDDWEMHTVLPASRGEQENCSRLQLRVTAAIPYTESSPADVGDFLADMELNGKPSLEASCTYLLFIFCRGVCDGLRRDCREFRSDYVTHAP